MHEDSKGDCPFLCVICLTGMTISKERPPQSPGKDRHSWGFHSTWRLASECTSPFSKLFPVAYIIKHKDIHSWRNHRMTSSRNWAELEVYPKAMERSASWKSSGFLNSSPAWRNENSIRSSDCNSNQNPKDHLPCCFSVLSLWVFCGKVSHWLWTRELARLAAQGAERPSCLLTPVLGLWAHVTK